MRLTDSRFRFVCGALALAALIGGLWLMGPASALAQGETMLEGAPPAPAQRTSVAEAFFLPRNPSTGRIEVFGALIIWFLLLLSVSSIGLMGTMAVRNRRQSILPPDVHDVVLKNLRAGRSDGIAREVQGDDSFFAAVLRAALVEAGHGYDAMVRAGEQAAEELTLRRLRHIEPLNIIGNVAPMIGLFGTVYGMILAFRAIVGAGGTPDPVDLAAGIGTALTTTFWGLVVAIPALAGHAILRNRIDGLTIEATRAAEEVVGAFRPRKTPDSAKREDAPKAKGVA